MVKEAKSTKIPTSFETRLAKRIHQNGRQKHHCSRQAEVNTVDCQMGDPENRYQPDRQPQNRVFTPDSFEKVLPSDIYCASFPVRQFPLLLTALYC